jgi:hypothetical protein
MTQAMLAELNEADATGRIAEIYAEIRLFSGVPYVSSLQRYLATMPGVLEWAWDALRPAIASGAIPETGWRLAASVRLAPAAPVAAATLRDWGLGSADLAAVRNIAANFVRVSPVNLVTGACLDRLLAGAAPAGPDYALNWTPPAMLPPMPGNAAAAALSAETNALLMRFATEVDGRPFIPALYRQVAHWPPVLAWLAGELAPRLIAPETAALRATFRDTARTAARDIVARLPGLPPGPPPDADTARRVRAVIDRYAETSPEMTMFGQLVLDALPKAV